MAYYSNLAGQIFFFQTRICISVVPIKNDASFLKSNMYNTLSNAFILSTNKNYQILIDSNVEIKLAFDNFYEKWDEETKYLSSPKMFENIYYKKIISLGIDVVPVIITKLKETPAHLFAALHKITGVNPVRPENKGNIKKMSDDWIAWWEQNKNAGA